MQYSASIVLYQNDFKELLPTLKDLVVLENLDILYLIDNSPTKNLQTQIEQFSQKIKYVHLNKNIGFGSGHNVAIKKAARDGFKIHFIINPDIRIERAEDIDSLANHIKNSKNCGLVVPKIIYPNGSIYASVKHLPNPFILFIRRFIKLSPISRFVDNIYEIKVNEKELIFKIPKTAFVSGCFMCISIPTFNLVEGFDERFFMYMEDVDLCRKISHISEIHYISTSQVIHVHNRESHRNNKLLFIHISSALKYFAKWCRK